MNSDFLFALYVFCSDYHSGQGSRLYRLLSRLTKRRISMSDHAMEAIRQGDDNDWPEAGECYRELVLKYASDGR